MSTSPREQPSAPSGSLGAADGTAPRARPPGGTAWASLGAHLRFWPVAVIGLTVDLVTKEWAFHRLRQSGETIVVIPRVLEFHTMFNTGALFGIGPGQTALFIGASLLALGLVLGMFVRSSPRRRLLQVALGAILAGALGNMYDRVFVQLYEFPPHARIFYELIDDDGARLLLRQYPADHPQSRDLALPVELRHELGRPVGCVRDFIKIPTRFGGRDLWPWVFNVADMLLVGGVAVLAVYLWRDGRHAAPDRPAPGGGSAGGSGAAGGMLGGGRSGRDASGGGGAPSA